MESATTDLFATADNPVPEGAMPTWILAKDGVKLRVARWAAQAPSRGTVAVMPGYSEFIEKYFEVIGELLARGFDVVAMDWRGHGLSDRLVGDRRKGHIDDFSMYQLDLEALESFVLKPFCPKPWFALGHSMGGAILLAQAYAGGSPFERLILSAPMIALSDLKIRGTQIVLEALDVMGFGGWTVPGGSKSARVLETFEANRTTSDSTRYYRTAAIIRAAPSLELGDPTIAWAHAAARLTREFADIDYPRRMTTPILVVAAGNDKVIPIGATELFASRLKTGRLITIPYAGHEILMEKDGLRRQFWAAFDAFIPGEMDAFAERLHVLARQKRRRWWFWPFGKRQKAA
jgi:lysophospholipase